MSEPLTFGSLFAGIGGFDLGFERAGMVCKWQVEIDDYANRVLRKHWPDVRRWPDVRTWPQPDTERVDVICSGFPCQDISYAGLGAGIQGERSGLFFEAVRVVRQLKPRILVLENVAALLTRGMDAVLGTLAAIGYDAEWESLPASAFGCYHERDRVFIVAYKQGAVSGVFGQSRAEWQAQFKHRRLASSSQARAVERFGDRMEGEPDVACLVHGVSDGLGRGLGNAVVPQVAEYVGRMVVERLKGLQDE
jgi:DNA (cytosine-5)-methyltransferase 1